MTSVAGAWALAARSTSRPSPSGIRRSVMTRSKTSSARRFMPAAALSAAATSVHRLDAVEGEVPHDLRELVTVEGEARHRGIDGDPHVDPARAGAVVADQPAHVIDDLADVAVGRTNPLGTSEVQEVRQDP